MKNPYNNRIEYLGSNITASACYNGLDSWLKNMNTSYAFSSIIVQARSSDRVGFYPSKSNDVKSILQFTGNKRRDNHIWSNNNLLYFLHVVVYPVCYVSLRI